jgi:drug/metabolite transporter (DMT)-like permease
VAAPEWLWIALTVGAALLQTFRNAAQRHLTATLGTLGATLVRFLYGLPFTLTWLAAVALIGGYAWPALSARLLGWVALGAVMQLAATALLLQVMKERNFALGVAYSKTEVILVAIFAFAILGEQLTAGGAAAIAIGTLGVMLLSPADPEHPLRALLTGWTTRSALLGISCGANFALSGVCFRAAALSLPEIHFAMAAAVILTGAQLVQTGLLGGWLLARQPGAFGRIGREWRTSLFAGCMGATASIGWYTAVAIEPVAHVRTLALIELVFVYAVSRRFFREKITPREVTGMLLLALGLSIVTLAR